MKHIILTIALLGIFAGTLIAAPPAPQEVNTGASASFGEAGDFYGALTPYGEWLELDAGFYAWRPSHVRTGWRPYLHGRWAWTDYGWYWMSDEPFGWATYHYGRWYFDDDYGWVWIPDRTWGPAWVEWRYNDDYLGWAPLPPYASFSIGVGIRFTTHWFAPHHYWNFVRYRYMTSPYIYREVVPLSYAQRLISTTRSAGRYEFEHGRIINRGLEREFVVRRGGFNRIDRLEIRDSHEIGERYVRDRNANRIDVYRPDFNTESRTHERIEARRIERGTSLDLQKVERGRHEDSKMTQPGETERTRRTTVPDARTPQERTPQTETNRPREERVQRPRETNRIEVPQPSPVERREIERRKENRYPFPSQEKAVQPQTQQQRNTAVEKPQRENRREIKTPREKVRESRPAPEVKKESPRGSDQVRREGSRRRD